MAKILLVCSENWGLKWLKTPRLIPNLLKFAPNLPNSAPDFPRLGHFRPEISLQFPEISLQFPEISPQFPEIRLQVAAPAFSAALFTLLERFPLLKPHCQPAKLL
ncbi:MAG: hypothetical protein IKA48_15960 [Fibrobacter sp.]|nr:hypothetical protein [Fibrobacter sp.]